MQPDGRPGRKSFSFFRKQAPELVPFDLNGETFTARTDLVGMELLNFVAQATAGDAESALAVKNMLRRCIVEYDVFEKLTSDPTSGVGIEELTEIAQWLVELSTARPTESSSLPLDGGLTGGATLTAERF